MIRRLLGWLRYADGGPVDEQSAPADRVCPHGVDSLEECGPCTITAIDAAILDAVADRHTAAVDRLLEARSAVRRRHRVRTSVPVTPGRQP